MKNPGEKDRQLRIDEETKRILEENREAFQALAEGSNPAP